MANDLNLAIRIRADGTAEVVGAARTVSQAIDGIGATAAESGARATEGGGRVVQVLRDTGAAAAEAAQATNSVSAAHVAATTAATNAASGGARVVQVLRDTGVAAETSAREGERFGQIVRNTSEVAATAATQVSQSAGQVAAAHQASGKAAEVSAGQMSMASRIVTSNLINIGNVAVATKGDLAMMASPLPDVIYGLRLMGGSVATVVTGVAALAAGLAAAAWVVSSYASSQRDLERAIKSTGGAAGVTRDQVRDMASAVGAATSQGAAGLRDMATAAINAGIASQRALGLVLSISKDWGAEIGTDADAAAVDLTRLASDPLKALDELQRRYHNVTVAEREYVHSLAEGGQMGDAQAEVLAKIGRAAEGSADKLSFWSRLWSGIKAGLGDSLDRLGATFSGAQPTAEQEVTTWRSLSDQYPDDATYRRKLSDALQRRAAEQAQAMARANQAAGSDAAYNAGLNYRQTIDPLGGLAELRNRRSLYEAGIGGLESQVGPWTDAQTKSYADLKAGLAALTEAERSYMSEGQKSLALAQASANAAGMDAAARDRYLAVRRVEIELAGQVVEPGERERRIKAALREVDAGRAAAARDATDATRAQIAAARDLVRALGEGDVAALRQRAANDAREEARTNPAVDVAARTRQLLGQRAASAGVDMAGQLAQYRQQVDGEERVAAAVRQGTAAQAEAARANQVTAQTAAYRNALEAAGVKDVDGLVAAYDDLSRRQLAAQQAQEEWGRAVAMSPRLTYEQEIAELDRLRDKLLALGVTEEEIDRQRRDAGRRRLESSREWGDGVSRALQDYADDAGNAAKQAEEFTSASLKAGEDSWVNWAKTGKIAVSDLFSTLEEAALRAFYRLAVYKPMEGMISSVLGGSLWDSLFGPTVRTGTLATPVADTGNHAMAHGGGVVGSGGLGTRQVSAEAWRGADRYHSGGLVGRERAIIALDGEEVLTEDNPRHVRNAGRIAQAAAPVVVPPAQVAVNLEVVNQTSTPVKAQVQEGAKSNSGPGGMDQRALRLVLTPLVKDIISSGDADTALRDRGVATPRRRVS